jgi:quercetin dioxygenase-like cupin family protein
MQSGVARYFPYLLLAALTLSLAAQSPPESTFQFSCRPASERTAEAGCWIIASHPLGERPSDPIFWSLDVFPNRAAAEAARTPHGTVVEALGKVWLLTIDTKLALPSTGQKITQIGPLPVKNGEAYTAQFMEAILPPGAIARTHRHPGPEAFYTESGETCLETPEGKTIGRKGANVIIPEGPPMSLSVSGTETRRSLVLVLHSSSHPAIIVADDWKPKGLGKH